jgi:hypothetical protein
MFISAIVNSLESRRQRQNHIGFVQHKPKTMKFQRKICAHASPQGERERAAIAETSSQCLIMVDEDLE